ncbi:hypothetical protein EI94DRAFT_1905949 [Lactarius quietus]|nr:hypothetical protein EI94DRAFT_1905949 [Lactarius quietus]
MKAWRDGICPGWRDLCPALSTFPSSYSSWDLAIAPCCIYDCRSHHYHPDCHFRVSVCPEHVRSSLKSAIPIPKPIHRLNMVFEAKGASSTLLGSRIGRIFQGCQLKLIRRTDATGDGRVRWTQRSGCSGNAMAYSQLNRGRRDGVIRDGYTWRFYVEMGN